MKRETKTEITRYGVAAAAITTLLYVLKLYAQSLSDQMEFLARLVDTMCTK